MLNGRLNLYQQPIFFSFAPIEIKDTEVFPGEGTTIKDMTGFVLLFNRL